MLQRLIALTLAIFLISSTAVLSQSISPGPNSGPHPDIGGATLGNPYLKFDNPQGEPGTSWFFDYQRYPQMFGCQPPLIAPCSPGVGGLVGGTPMLELRAAGSTAPNTISALFPHIPGVGVGFWLWPLTVPIWWFPGRGEPTFAVFGDGLIGELATMSMPGNETAWGRNVNAGLGPDDQADLFAAMWGCPRKFIQTYPCQDANSGSVISRSPLDMTTGAPTAGNDGYIDLIAQGWDSGADANSIFIWSRDGLNHVTKRWQISGPTGGGHEYDIIPAVGHAGSIGSPDRPVKNLQVDTINGQLPGDFNGGGTNGTTPPTEAYRFVEAGPLSPGATKYTGAWAGTPGGAASAAYTMVLASVPQTTTQLIVYTDTSPGQGLSFAFTIIKNGAPTGMACNVVNVTQQCTITGALDVVPGDRLQMREVSNSNVTMVSMTSVLR